mmetsp:Transcript_38958/g.76586  ORF Transcript_38958/g.76586 Transcript_38958/m.76586 type:complete len:640 (-) Transcript_38958:120-2039(-)
MKFLSFIHPLIHSRGETLRHALAPYHADTQQSIGLFMHSRSHYLPETEETLLLLSVLLISDGGVFLRGSVVLLVRRKLLLVLEGHLGDLKVGKGELLLGAVLVMLDIEESLQVSDGLELLHIETLEGRLETLQTEVLKIKTREVKESLGLGLVLRLLDLNVGLVGGGGRHAHHTLLGLVALLSRVGVEGGELDLIEDLLERGEVSEALEGEELLGSLVVEETLELLLGEGVSGVLLKLRIVVGGDLGDGHVGLLEGRDFDLLGGRGEVGLEEPFLNHLGELSGLEVTLDPGLDGCLVLHVSSEEVDVLVLLTLTELQELISLIMRREHHRLNLEDLKAELDGLVLLLLGVLLHGCGLRHGVVLLKVLLGEGLVALLEVKLLCEVEEGLSVLLKDLTVVHKSLVEGRLGDVVLLKLLLCHLVLLVILPHLVLHLGELELVLLPPLGRKLILVEPLELLVDVVLSVDVHLVKLQGLSVVDLGGVCLNDLLGVVLHLLLLSEPEPLLLKLQNALLDVLKFQSPLTLFIHHLLGLRNLHLVGVVLAAGGLLELLGSAEEHRGVESLEVNLSEVGDLAELIKLQAVELQSLIELQPLVGCQIEGLHVIRVLGRFVLGRHSGGSNQSKSSELHCVVCNSEMESSC